MKSKFFWALTIIWFYTFLPLDSYISAASKIMSNEFSFYSIGAEDTKDTASEKLNRNGFHCAPAKSTHLGIDVVQEQRPGLKPTEKLEILRSMDEDLKDHGEGLQYKEMPIDALACNPPNDNPFTFSTYLFSSVDQKIMAIDIEIEKVQIVKDKLASKFGPCISEGYCESKNSILIFSENHGWSLHVYFFNNLKPLHDKIKNKTKTKNKKIKEKIDEAF